MKPFLICWLLAALPAMAAYAQPKPGAAFAAYAPKETTVVIAEDAHTGLLRWHDYSQDDKFVGLRNQFKSLLTQLLAYPETELRRLVLTADAARLATIAAAPQLTPGYALLNERLLPGIWFWRLTAVDADGTQTPLVVAVRQTGKTYALAPLTEAWRSSALATLALRLDAEPFLMLTAMFPAYSAEREAQFAACRIPAKNNVVDLVSLAEILSHLSEVELKVLNEELEALE